MRVGPGLDANTEVGPLVDEASVRKVDSLVCDAISQGAMLLTGGEPLDGTAVSMMVTPDTFYPDP